MFPSECPAETSFYGLVRLIYKCNLLTTKKLVDQKLWSHAPEIFVVFTCLTSAPCISLLWVRQIQKTSQWKRLMAAIDPYSDLLGNGGSGNSTGLGVAWQEQCGSSELGKGSAAWFRDEWSGKSHKSFFLKLSKAFLNLHRTLRASRAQNHYYLPLCLELSLPWKPFKSAS